MSIPGSCLCGLVKFRIAKASGPFEICHCNRCRKVSGSIGMPMLGVRVEDYEFLTGGEAIASFDAPIIYSPPVYHTQFCSRCGSPVPPAHPTGAFVEIPAGLLDDDPGLRPDKHIYTEFMPAWDQISDNLPRPTVVELCEQRGIEVADDFKLKSHYDADGI